MTTTLATPDTSLATFPTALSIDTKPYVIGDRSTGLVVVDILNGFYRIIIDIDTQRNVLLNWINEYKLEALVVGFCYAKC